MSFSDKEYYHLNVSISKALSGIEMPLKGKHARAAIIGTFHTQGAHAFWTITLRQPLQENRITAWKFCHLLHKILREGHGLCCQHSMRHRSMLSELGKLWGHLNDGYGLSIRHYTKLLITKLEFHDRNPRIPGNLTLKRGELEAIANNDVNFYFQMAVEMFDYLDDIIALQATIFNSITTFHVNSMTSAGQCRLSPLIPLIQDSNQLYDFLVRIMFKLHGNLPNDVLGGHRDRFRAIFIQLKSFYNQSKNLQYFLNLITVPKLPENAPNFGSQVEFGAYTAPVVIIPETEPELEQEPEPEPIVDNLIDTAITVQHESVPVQQQHQSKPRIDFEQIIRQRDDLIRHLQMEIERLGTYLKMVITEHRDEVARLAEQVAALNSQLSDAHEELTNMRFVKEELELKAQSVDKSQVEEERIKASEEKFLKLKVMYTQIRDEHVKLLRKHGEVSKQLATSTKIASEATKEKESALSQLEDLQHSHQKAEENLQESSDQSEKLKNELSERVHILENKNLVLNSKVNDLNSSKSEEISNWTTRVQNLEQQLILSKENEEILNKEKLVIEKEYKTAVETKSSIEHQLHSTVNELQQFQTKTAEYIKQEATLQQSVAETENTKAALSERIEQLQCDHEILNTRCEELTIQSATIENEKLELNQLLEQIKNEKLELTVKNANISGEKVKLKLDLTETFEKCSHLENEIQTINETTSSEITALKATIKENEDKYEQLNANNVRMRIEIVECETDMQDMLHEQELLIEKYNSTLSTINALESTLSDTKIREEARLRALVEVCIKSSENIAMSTIADEADGTSTYFLMIAEELQRVLNELAIVHESYVSDNTNVEGFARKIILSGHLMASIHLQGITICNTSADIECGERLSEVIKKWCLDVLDLFCSLRSENKASSVKDRIVNVKQKLSDITTVVHGLSKNSDRTETIADIIESELSGMDKAIEEAASKIQDLLTCSRASDSGIKLEVNEKILDACTALMNNIRFLVKKSRLLQDEIVLLGKGTASAKEFYKRNHQWTEGLISAAKSVAQGANFLVTAANKTVSGEAKHQLDLIVAAQEIAASTAQLVISSRVKAPRGSPNLAALGQASRDVTQATGAVVAIAKDCSQRLEDSQDLDLTNLTVHQAKTLEMEIQVKVLELEQALQMERSRLAAFRRKNYRES